MSENQHHQDFPGAIPGSMGQPGGVPGSMPNAQQDGVTEPGKEKVDPVLKVNEIAESSPQDLVNVLRKSRFVVGKVKDLMSEHDPDLLEAARKCQ